jgi:hypothetical protein
VGFAAQEGRNLAKLTSSSIHTAGFAACQFAATPLNLLVITLSAIPVVGTGQFRYFTIKQIVIDISK